MGYMDPNYQVLVVIRPISGMPWVHTSRTYGRICIGFVGKRCCCNPGTGITAIAGADWGWGLLHWGGNWMGYK